MFGLAHLLNPLSKSEFIENYLGNRAVLIQKEESAFKDLFGWTEVNHHLLHSRASFDGIRLAHESKPLDHAELARVDHWLQEGATLIINNVNRIDEVMKKFVDLLSKDLNRPVNVNCYASCPTKQGFDIHFDMHDVYIIQTEGTKKWAVFEPTKTFPLHIQNEDKGEPPASEPYLECELGVGDVLYIPRGHWHYAVATSPSVHLTVGPASIAAGEFLMWLAQHLMSNDELFRRDFPVADAAMLGGEGDDTSLDAFMQQFQQRIHEIFSSEALREVFIRYCMSTNPIIRRSDLPRTWLLEETITEDTGFAIPAEQKALIRYDPEPKSAVIHIRGKQVNLENIPASLIKAVFESESPGFCGHDILKACGDDDIDWNKIKELLLQMHRFGLIVLADQR